jgi:hypothetical protein
MMLPVIFFLAFQEAASLKLSFSEAPKTEARPAISDLLITDVLDADLMDDSESGPGAEQVSMIRSQQQQPRLEVDHFAKSGGTYVRGVAQKTIKTNLSIVREFTGNAGDPRNPKKQRAFTIGMIRNPFSYLVSLWAFGSYTKETRDHTSAFRATMNQVSTDKNKSHPSWGIAKDIMNSWSKDIPNGLPAGTTAEDQKRFAKWVHTVSPENYPGFVSGRFYCKYLDKGKFFPIEGRAGPAVDPTADVNCNTQVGPLNLHEQGTVNAKLPTIGSSLAAFSLADIAVDCWIVNENLHVTMTECFKQFEEHAGPGSVDWIQYQSILAKDGHANPSDHVECNKLYDNDLADYVSRAESGVLRAFNYKRC